MAPAVSSQLALQYRRDQDLMVKSTPLGKSRRAWAQVQTAGQVWLERLPVQGAPQGQVCDLWKRDWQQRSEGRHGRVCPGPPSSPGLVQQGWTEMGAGVSPVWDVAAYARSGR